ncbi:DUF4129 domain-containing protein [Halorubrum halodurans]|uniref:Protein-glutamine gamma-glutamyltransferase-like C-terminal domain-containing protein n=1 Tax=Halorubrum halodurans TaxID=1383851 RepID=A0A256IJD3_9EURY|nr:DUF4129 domain-containing protein [Halorubrum halodurans]OYR56614.1 hypothetical protein DJ70_08255 [Halorubrum halodurans]
MSTRYQGLVGVLAAILVVSAVVGGVGAASSPDPALQTGSGATGNGTTADGTVTNGTAANTTLPPHQNPEEVRQEGDSQRVAEHLASRLGTRLAESAVAISEQDLERGQVLLDEGYDEELARYATVARDLDEEELATRFDLTREEQASLAETLRETETLATEYQRAVENGDDERARELARDLLEQAEKVTRTTADLEERYTVLENETGIELSEATVAIEEIRRTTGEATVAIQSREFTETRLVAETNRTRISASDPAGISGRLTTADGTPIENGTIRIQLGDDIVTTETGQNGSFTATYRPLLAAMNASTVAVAYEPEPTDPYLPATDTIAVSIAEQAGTSVDLENTSSTAAFDEPVRATGAVRVAGVDTGSLDGIPVVLGVGGRRLATGETGPNGGVELAGTLPATVPTGENELRVAIDRRDAAIARSAETASLSVRETPTALSVAAAIDGGGDGEGDRADEVDLSGRLVAAEAAASEGGRGLAGRPVVLSIGGAVLGTVETGADGTYRTTVDVPASAGPGDELPVTASYEGAGTNLAGSTAEARTLVPRPDAAIPRPDAVVASDSAVGDGVVAGIVATLLGLGAYLVVRRRRPERLRRVRRRVLGTDLGDAGSGPDGAAEAAGASSVVGEVADGPRTPSGVATDPDRSPLSRARAELAAGRPDETARIVYAVVRSRLGRSAEDASSETHWEFYRRWRDDDEVDAAGLETVTEAYERAEFAPHEVPSRTADDAVDAGDDVLDSRTPSADREER